MQVEEHAAARHCDGEADRDPGQDGLLHGRRAAGPASSASAAKNAAAVDECPLGKDGPSVAASGSIVGRARSTALFTRFVTSESPSVTTIRNGGMKRLGTRAHSIAPIDDGDQEDARGRCQVRDLLEDAMRRLGAVRLGPSSRGGVDAGERVAPADSEREDARRPSPRPRSPPSASVSARPVSDLGVEPAPDEPAARACARGPPPRRRRPGHGPTTCEAPRAAPRHATRPAAVETSIRTITGTRTSLPATRSGKPCMIVAVQQQTARA